MGETNWIEIVAVWLWSAPLPLNQPLVVFDIFPLGFCAICPDTAIGILVDDCMFEWARLIVIGVISRPRRKTTLHDTIHETISD
ncbi:hypothetical protein [Haloarcula onubensis]|uniref:Uncharacterized protein n=1 Tax=Haloarcula onubensis TaxID=2950539 RepID=A0ABU2FST1_9EURY|nr:hypothetical protein [Halomicroarcula sp. S3CR25-11]MDS0283828.1 hypothetical protein [Halomicroarcula sp. S3CR25-11]